MPLPEDTLFCAYKETRVPTYHLNSSSPANILRIEKASICDATSAPNSPPTLFTKKVLAAFTKQLSISKWGGLGMEENRKALHTIPFESDAQSREAGLRPARALGE